jgi:hypothetical protein
MTRLIAVMAVWLLPLSSFSCDACGCAPAMTSWGILPNQFMNFVGLQPSYRLFRSTHPPGIDFKPGTNEEHFLRIELNARITLHRRWQLLLSAPYRHTAVSGISEAASYSGPGDASVQAGFLVIEPDESKQVRHGLQVTAGAELPTGRFEFSHEVPTMFQQGSGTYDLLAGLQYSVRAGRMGILTEASARRNGVTRDHFHPGNSAQALARLFFVHRRETSRWLPSAGVSYETWKPDITDIRFPMFRAAYTGGLLLSATCGIDVFTPRFAFGLEYQLPVNQHIGDGWSNLVHGGRARVLFFIVSKPRKNDLQ